MAKPTKSKREPELKLSGSTLGTRFSVAMSIALAVVMIGAGAFLYSWVVSKAQEIQETAFVDAVSMQGPMQERYYDNLKRELEGRPLLDLSADNAQTIANTAKTFDVKDVKRWNAVFGPDFKIEGYVYIYKDVKPPLYVSAKTRDRAGEGLLSMIIVVTMCVIIVGALVAWTVGGSVSRPLELLVADINQIAAGDLRHRTRVRAGGEILMLAKAVDRMAGNLEAAQEAQLELSSRERELAVAAEVREALLPQATPAVPGFEIAALHVDSPTPGGDFHEFIERGDGRIGLLVCDVSGRGVPGALIGAIARSYLRVELSRTDEDIAGALSRVNRLLARDVRRGMFATAAYVLLDPREGTATVASAGHKLPIIRYSASDKKIRVVHPEGIALGFDQGPVFDRTLQVQKIPIEPGDRVFLATTGAVQVKNADEAELGEKGFYRIALQHAGLPLEKALAAMQAGLAEYAAGTPFPNDISLVALGRRA